jgi:hypothetical protein
LVRPPRCRRNLASAVDNRNLRRVLPVLVYVAQR